MLLLIDAGNTRIKWALVAADSAAGGWLASGAVAHAQIDTLAAQWAQLAIHEALLSNVAGAISARACAHAAGRCPRLCLAATAGGPDERLRAPVAAGCDRFAAAIGARRRWRLARPSSSPTAAQPPPLTPSRPTAFSSAG